MSEDKTSQTELKPGQIVSIRKRLWRIDAVYKNELSATSIDGIANIQKRFYIPFENIQPAKIDIPQFDRIGELSKQQLLINAYRISLIHGTSPLLSLQRSSVIPTNFQLVPVIMALNAPRVRLLIADDIGLGKTIEAGLIMSELIGRHMIRKILIICPASLREQWQETLLNFFKLDFNIISSLRKKYLEKELPIGLSPWDYFQKLITSVDYAKSKANKNEILNYDWDLAIVDETHLCARPHVATSSESAIMQRWEILREIAKKTKHLLLLTATPHNGYTESFASLIEILDIQATNKNNLAFIDKRKAKKHVCQRTRKDVERWLKEEGSDFNPFPQSDKKEVHIQSLTKIEAGIYKDLKQYGNEIIKLISSSNLQYTVQFTILHFLKRALSSPRALRISLRNRIDKIKSGSDESEINEDDVKALLVETDNFENISVEEASQRVEKSTFGKSVSDYEIKQLEKIYEDVSKIRPANDSKYSKLINTIIPELFGFSNKMIIFTRYKDTLEYLKDNLTKDFNDAQILGIYGDIKSEQRKEIFAQFEKAKKAILVATDCISEGMNLQFLCSQIIHYELPWNPNRLEQRNGRVDRFGQPEKTVHIRTIIMDGTLDEDILEKIIEKADRIKSEFGFAPPFFNDETDIINRLIKAGKVPRTRRRKEEDPSQLTFFNLLFEERQKEEVIKDEYDEEDKNVLERIKNDSFYGQGDIRLPDIERRLRETEKTIGSKDEIEKFIISSLNLFGCRFQQVEKEIYNLTLNDKRLLLPGRGDVIKNVTFDKNYAARNPSVELIDLSHPLVTRLVQIIKQQTHIEQELYGRTSYKMTDSVSTPVALLKVLVRYMVGTQSNSLIEDILTLGFGIYNKKTLTNEEIMRLEQSVPKRGNRTIAEFKDDMREIFGNQFWKDALTEMVEDNRQKIIKERELLIANLKYDELPEWLKGVADLTYISHDIITIMLGYPA